MYNANVERRAQVEENEGVWNVNLQENCWDYVTKQEAKYSHREDTGYDIHSGLENTNQLFLE